MTLYKVTHSSGIIFKRKTTYKLHTELSFDIIYKLMKSIKKGVLKLFAFYRSIKAY